MSAISDLAAAIPASMESLRASITDPIDQIRTLLSFAKQGLGSSSTGSTSTVGIAGYQQAGSTGTWANTNRSTVATWFDAAGVARTAQPKTVRPLYISGVLTGYMDEPAATNINLRSTNMSSSYYNVGSASVDLGLVTAPDGSTTARRIRCGPSGPGNGFLNRNTLIAVTGSTTYTASIYLRLNAGTVTGGGAVTVDELDASFTTLLRNGTAAITSIGSAWTRITRTFTTAPTAAWIVMYTADNWTVGAELDIWGLQIETGSTATSLIYTTSTPVTRAADAITLRTPSQASNIATAQAIAASSTNALIRRAALVSLARAIALYEPQSSAEAKSVLTAVMPLYDAEILVAGDAGDNASYAHLRSLRAAVSRDLQARGLLLPEVITVSTERSRPSLVAAHALYEDSTRETGLLQRANVQHPLFMPSSYEALSS